MQKSVTALDFKFFSTKVVALNFPNQNYDSLTKSV